MRGGHNSRGLEQRFDALGQGLVLLELIQQKQLIEQDRTQDDQLGPIQAFDVWQAGAGGEQHIYFT